MKILKFQFKIISKLYTYPRLIAGEMSVILPENKKQKQNVQLEKI